jgi:hypothetical protein
MRKEKIVTMPADAGRDAGKSYKITEMPAWKAEKWGLRVMAAVGRSGMFVPDAVLQRGLAGVAIVGLRGLMMMQFADAEPLLDEMMTCVERAEAKAVRALVDDDIEEVVTFLKLRSEVLEVHTGFSMAAYLSEQWAASRNPTTGDGSNTPTSAMPSAQ